jgi:hypothetical protein
MQKNLTFHQDLIPGASLDECRKISPSTRISSVGPVCMNAEKSHLPAGFDSWGQSE